jgi:hypothetical protein
MRASEVVMQRMVSSIFTATLYPAKTLEHVTAMNTGSLHQPVKSVKPVGMSVF